MSEISLTKQLFLSEDEATTVRTTIMNCAKNPGFFENLIDDVLKHRLEWSGSQNFLAGFILGRLLQDEMHKEQNTLHPGAPHAR